MKMLETLHSTLRIKTLMIFTVLAVGLLIGVSSNGHAMMINLRTIQDTGIRSDAPSTPAGSGSTTEALEHLPGWKTNRGLFSWDLPSNLLGSTVNSANVTFYVRYLNQPTSYASNSVLSVHQITQGWMESTATWNTYDGINSWSQPGNEGDMSGPYVSGTFTSMGYDVTPSDTRTIQLDVTTLVQSWADGTQNYGFMLAAGNNSINSFWTMDQGISSAAKLDVDYSPATVPEPSTVLLLLVGAGLAWLVVYRRTAKLLLLLVFKQVTRAT